MNSIELKFLIDVGVGKGIENYSDRIKNCFCVFQNDKFRIRKINR